MVNGAEAEAPQSPISNGQDEKIQVLIWQVINNWNEPGEESFAQANKLIVSELWTQYIALYNLVAKSESGLGALSQEAALDPETYEPWLVELVRSVVVRGVTFDPTSVKSPLRGTPGDLTSVDELVVAAREEDVEIMFQTMNAGTTYVLGEELYAGSLEATRQAYKAGIQKLYGRPPTDAEWALITQLTAMDSPKDVIDNIAALARTLGPAGETARVLMTVINVGEKGYLTDTAQATLQLEEYLSGQGLTSDEIDFMLKGAQDPSKPWSYAAYRAASKAEPGVDPRWWVDVRRINPNTKLEYMQWAVLQPNWAASLEPYRASLEEKALTDAAEMRVKQIKEGIDIGGDFNKMMMTAFGMPHGTAEVFNKLGGESPTQYLDRITRYLAHNARFFQIAEDASTIFAGIVPEDFEFPSEFTGPELYEFLLGAGVISFADLPVTAMPGPEQAVEALAQAPPSIGTGFETALAGFPAGPFLDEFGTNVMTSQQAATAADREAFEREQEEFAILQGLINEGLTEGDLEQRLGFLEDMPALFQLLEAQFAMKTEQFEAETATAQEFASQTLLNLQNIPALQKQLAAKQQKVLDPNALDFAAQQKALNQEITTLQEQIGFAQSVGEGMTPGGVVQPTTGPLTPIEAITVGKVFPMEGLVEALTPDQTFGGFIQQNFGTLAQQFRERRLETVGPPPPQQRRSRRTIFTPSNV